MSSLLLWPSWAQRMDDHGPEGKNIHLIYLVIEGHVRDEKLCACLRQLVLLGEDVNVIGSFGFELCSVTLISQVH